MGHGDTVDELDGDEVCMSCGLPGGPLDEVGECGDCVWARANQAADAVEVQRTILAHLPASLLPRELRPDAPFASAHEWDAEFTGVRLRAAANEALEAAVLADPTSQTIPAPRRRSA
jgi:hypothetical protein